MSNNEEAGDRHNGDDAEEAFDEWYEARRINSSQDVDCVKGPKDLQHRLFT